MVNPVRGQQAYLHASALDNDHCEHVYRFYKTREAGMVSIAQMDAATPYYNTYEVATAFKIALQALSGAQLRGLAVTVTVGTSQQVINFFPPSPLSVVDTQACLNSLISLAGQLATEQVNALAPI